MVAASFVADCVPFKVTVLENAMACVIVDGMTEPDELAMILPLKSRFPLPSTATGRIVLFLLLICMALSLAHKLTWVRTPEIAP